MPTNTDVTKLKINSLTEAQFDAAVQSGVIGANEISFITDLDEAIQYKVMPEAKAENEGQIIQYTGEPNECTVGSYVNQYGVAPTLMPTFVYNAETFATFLSDRGANPNTGTDILFTAVPNDETGGMDLKITYNNGQDEYVVNLEAEFPNWSSYPPSKAEEYDEMYGALGFETNYTELCSVVEIMNTLNWMDNPDGDGCISLTLPNPSNYVNGYFYKNTPTSVKITNGSLSVLYFDGGDDEEDLPAPEPITFNVDTFNAYAASVSQPEVDHVDFFVEFETSPETGDRESILIHYNEFNDTISISLSEDSIPVIQSALASVGVGIDFTGFTRFNSLDATLPIENVCSWQQVDVQPGGGSSYTAGNGISIDANNEISVTDPVLVNKADNVSDIPYKLRIASNSSSSNSNYYVAIGYGANVTNSDYGIAIGTTWNQSGAYSASVSNAQHGIAIGYQSQASNSAAISVGTSVTASGLRTIAIGEQAEAVASHAIAIGGYTGGRGNPRASAAGAIQIGCGRTLRSTNIWENSDADTFKVGNENGNFEMMSADGTIPEARLADTTSAVQGQVLTLNANGNAEWANPSTGGPTSLTVTLQGGSSNWPSNTQTVTVQGVTSTNTIFAGAAPASVRDYDNAGIICIAQNTDELTFECVTVPTNNITVNVLIIA